jgi:hypothetical protein
VKTAADGAVSASSQATRTARVMQHLPDRACS